MYIHTSTGEKTVYWVVIRQIGGLFNQHNATNSKSFTGQLLYLLDYRAYTWQITAKSRTNVHLADNNNTKHILCAQSAVLCNGDCLQSNGRASDAQALGIGWTSLGHRVNKPWASDEQALGIEWTSLGHKLPKRRLVFYVMNLTFICFFNHFSLLYASNSTHKIHTFASFVLLLAVKSKDG